MKALFVAWRAGDDGPGAWGPVGRLEHDGLFRFCYTKGARLIPGFRPFAQMANLEQVYESEELFPLFANRLLSPSRPEYEMFLRWGGFNPGDLPDPIAVLSVTEGIRQTDAIEVFPCPQPDGTGCYINKFFLHGVRWAPEGALALIANLQSGERLHIAPEPANPVDPNAVAVFHDGTHARIGYVPRYLAKDVTRLLEQCGTEITQLFVERVNPDAPLQQRVLCRMSACWPEEFQPCSGEAFQPIPAGVATHCGAYH
jgi:hypothetical protein